MITLASPGRRCRAALLLVLLFLPQAAWTQQTSDDRVESPLILELDWLAPRDGLTKRPSPPSLPEGVFSPMTTLSHGRWAEACAGANRILAQRVPDIEALGIFALCAALSGDEQATSLALARLREVGSAPRFALLADGVRQLRAGRRDAASARFAEVLQHRADDPLALYFDGETLYAAGESRQALAAFEATLKTWPEHVPAMTAAARVLAAATASDSDLVAARDLAERATKLDPWTQANWRLLAELCRRTGQSERAEAITLQWLRLPVPTR